MLSKTFIAAYHCLSVKGYLQPQQVMAVYEITPGGCDTRQQRSSLTGISLHRICGRMHSLLDKIVPSGFSKESASGRGTREEARRLAEGLGKKPTG